MSKISTDIDMLNEDYIVNGTPDLSKINLGPDDKFDLDLMHTFYEIPRPIINYFDKDTVN
ncbi:MAG: hypothetical protein GY928_13495 [Colwellia sp.]|nr:hypothetical protein [Colwellia sp.]